MRRPIADPFDVYPDLRPTLHEHCRDHQRCSGPGCRARGKQWPRHRQRNFQTIKPQREGDREYRPILPIPHRVVDILPASQVIALWEFRQGLVQERGEPTDKTMHAVTRKGAVHIEAYPGTPIPPLPQEAPSAK